MRIFILASERSGTNLLRTLIGNHKEVSAPVAPHLFHEFYRNIDLYGDLRRQENKKELLQDMLRLVNHEYHNWQLSKQSVSIAMGLGNVDTLAKAIDFFYLEKAKQSDKNSYCSKGIHNYDHAHYVKSAFSDAKFIYLVRDPRDVTASWLRTPLHLHTAYKIAYQWNEQQAVCRRVQACYPDDVIFVRYEELTGNTEKEMTRIMEGLGLPVDDNCFSTDRGNRESKNNELWKNLNKPVIKRNSSKYLTSLSPEEINIVETVARESMVLANYTDFNSATNWEMGNPVLFKIKEMVRTRKSKQSRGEAIQKVKDRVYDKYTMMRNVRKRLVEKASTNR